MVGGPVGAGGGGGRLEVGGAVASGIALVCSRSAACEGFRERGFLCGTVDRSVPFRLTGFPSLAATGGVAGLLGAAAAGGGGGGGAGADELSASRFIIDMGLVVR